MGPDLDHEQFGLWFPSAQVGYIGMAHSGDGWLDKTTDGGRHWAPLVIPKELSAVKTVWFADEQHGWLGPLWGTPVMARTDDGGQTWKMIDLRPTLKGKIDNVNNWQHLGFYAWDMDHVLLAGDGGLILRTADGGATWQATAGPDLPARAVSFCDREHGLLVGPAGATAHTSDGGATWQAVLSGAQNDLTSVACVSPTEGWATGMAVYKGAPSFSVAGCMLHTTDGGRTWKNESVVCSGLRCVFFLDAQHGWAVGGSGGSASEPAEMVLRYWEP